MVGGQEREFTKLHFVLVEEYQPGVSGRLSLEKQFMDYFYEELQSKNKPVQVDLRLSIQRLREELMDHIDSLEKDYGPHSLEKHRSFAKKVLHMSYDQLASFPRAELELEVGSLVERERRSASSR